MNRLNPDRELDAFLRQAGNSYRRYVELFDAVGTSPNHTDLRRGLATDAAFRLGSEWESLQHRWHIAAIANGPHRLIQQRLDAVSRKVESLDQGTRTVFSVNVAPSKKTSLTRSEIELLIDDDGRNVTFKDSTDWAKKSDSVLTGASHARVRAIVADESQASVLDLLKALRNVIAHSSSNATELLNLAVRARVDGVGLVGAENAPFVIPKSSAGDVGKYLHSWIRDPRFNRFEAEGTRMSLLHRRVLAIAENLRL